MADDRLSDETTGCDTATRKGPGGAGRDDNSSDPTSDLEKGEADMPAPLPASSGRQAHKTSTVAAAHPAPDDPNAVWWDSDDDPENPYNWTAGKKWSVVAVLAFLTLLT